MKKTRLTALVLAIVLMVSILPVTAMAAWNYKVGDTVQVTASYLRYRYGCGTSYGIIDLYRCGTKAKVLEVSPKGLWFRCETPDGRTNGWFYGGYLKKVASGSSDVTTGTYVVSNKGLFVNLRASVGGAVLAKVPDGATVKVLSTSNGWSNVKYGTQTGFMMSHFLVRK